MKPAFAALWVVAAACAAPPAPPSMAPEHGARDRDPWAGKTLLAPPPPAPRAVSLPPISRLELENGLVVWLVEDRSIPVAEVHVAIAAGEREVGRGRAGLARFAAKLLVAGGDRAAGLALEGHASYEATWLSCEVLSAQLSTCLAALTEALVSPAFSREAMSQIERRLRAEVRARPASASQLAAQHLQNALWGDDHPRGWILSEASLDAITEDELRAWHARHVSAQNAVVAIAGDIDAEAIKGALEASLGTWPAREVAAPKRAWPPAHAGLRVRLIDMPERDRAEIHLGQRGISPRDRDAFAARLVHRVLAGGAASRLARALRQYLDAPADTAVTTEEMAAHGAVLITTETAAADAAEALAVMRREMRAFAARGPTDDEVSAAAGELADRYAMQFETAGDVAAAVLAAALRGLEPDALRDEPLALGEVSGDAARAAAARRVLPDELAVVIVGPARAIAPRLADAGIAFERIDHRAPVAGYERRRPRDARPPAAKPDAPAAPIDPAAARAAAAILDRALLAKGGYDRLAALETLALEGRVELRLGAQRIAGQLVRRLARPARLRVDIELRGGVAEITTAFDGARGFTRHVAGGRRQIAELQDAELGAARAESWRDPDLVLLRHREGEADAEALGQADLDGKPHHLVRLRDPDGHDVELAIDAASYELRRMRYLGPGGTETTEHFADYRDIGGLQIAHDRRTHSPAQRLELRIHRVRLDPPLDPATFKPPAEPEG